MGKVPTVSVVMSTYNSAATLSEAIDSILAQTFADFEFIIVNDGSSDNTRDVLKTITDQRVQVLEQENKGLVASLNRGIELAKGKYIARQDADDRSEPNRFQEQVNYLQSHPNVILVGSSMTVMDKSGKTTHKHAVLLGNNELKQELLVRSPFVHGSVMFNKDKAIQAGLYHNDTWPAEDYDLWLRLAPLGEFGNLDEYLYIYRETDAGISGQNATRQQEALKRVQQQAWSNRWGLTKTINLHVYNAKEVGPERVNRVITNVGWSTHKSLSKIGVLFAIKSLAMLWHHPRSCARALKSALGGSYE